MEIGNNPYSHYVDYHSRAQAQNKEVSQNQGHEHDTRGLEKSENSSDSKNTSQQAQYNQELSAQEKADVAKLQAVDAQVRAHEMAHQSGPAASGGASFSYTMGPDGRMYATGGEVPVRIQTSSDPQESIANLQGVIATALAPADPSPQDLQVASQARVLMMKAQQEFAQELQEEISKSENYTQNAKQQYESNSATPSREKGTDITA